MRLARTPRRCVVFAALFSHCYPEGIRHIILHEFNLPHIVSWDGLSGETRGSGARAHLNRWLSSLGVGDAWRRHHPDERVFTGPVQRMNRLDYFSLMNTFWIITIWLLRIFITLTVGVVILSFAYT